MIIRLATRQKKGLIARLVRGSKVGEEEEEEDLKIEAKNPGKVALQIQHEER